MATPTEDLVLRIPKDIQGTLADHARKLDKLETGQHGIRESIGTALGLFAHANVRNDLMEDRLGRLEDQIAEIEAIKARVQRLETEGA